MYITLYTSCYIAAVLYTMYVFVPIDGSIIYAMICHQVVPSDWREFPPNSLSWTLLRSWYWRHKPQEDIKRSSGLEMDILLAQTVSTPSLWAYRMSLSTFLKFLFVSPPRHEILVCIEWAYSNLMARHRQMGQCSMSHRTVSIGSCITVLLCQLSSFKQINLRLKKKLWKKTTQFFFFFLH